MINNPGNILYGPEEAPFDYWIPDTWEWDKPAISYNTAANRAAELLERARSMPPKTPYAELEAKLEEANRTIHRLDDLLTWRVDLKERRWHRNLSNLKRAMVGGVVVGAALGAVAAVKLTRKPKPCRSGATLVEEFTWDHARSGWRCNNA